jgi:anti-anti-sigma factor
MLETQAVRDGPVCTLIVSGALDWAHMGSFLYKAALAVDHQIERLILDLAAVTFVDCAGLGALAVAAGFAPASCPIVMRSLSPPVRRLAELLGLDPADVRALGSAKAPVPGGRDPAPARPIQP